MERAEVAKILEKFHPVGLEEMNSVRLMNRTDLKYVFSVNKLPGILNMAIGRYHVLKIDNQRDFQYSTTYLDSPDFMFLNQHINGRLPRFKIRYRVYEHSGRSFLEVKCKTSKNNTIKDRIKNNPVEGIIDSQGNRFLQDHIPIDTSIFKPVLTTKFVRLTLVGLETSERITIDYNLSFNDNSGKTIELPLLAIAELKREQFNNKSVFSQLLKDFNVRKTGFSKYCIGMSLLHNLPKQNTLKRKFLLINKIEKEAIA